MAKWKSRFNEVNWSTTFSRMKTKYLILLLILGVVYACASKKYNMKSPAYGGGTGKSKARSKTTFAGGSSGNTRTTSNSGASAGYVVNKSQASSYYSQQNNPANRLKTGEFKKIYGIKSVDDSVVFDEEVAAGLLTGGELSDFDKWELWQHIAGEDFNLYSRLWELEPKNRYVAQVITMEGRPAVDVPVELYDGGGKVIWSARTDNTGKAELWANNVQCSEISATVDGEPYSLDNPRKFADGINRIKVEMTCEVSNAVDIAFVVDATGSMEDEIQYLQFEMEDIIAKAKSNHSEFDFRTGSVFYRCTGNQYSYRVSDFSDEEQVTGDFIKKQSAREGGAELVDSALIAMVDEMEWSSEARARIAFLVLDEPPANDSLTKLNLKKTVAHAAARGIRIVPVVASANYGTEKSLEYLMRSVALFTNGSYVFLTDDSGIGHPHAKPTIDEYEVELLNQLMLRLIYEFTYVPPCDQSISLNVPQDTLIIKEIINQVVVDSSLLAYQDSLNNVQPDTALVVNPEDSTNIVITDPDDDADDDWSSDDLTVVDEIKVYPNPTLGNLTVEVKGEATEVYVADIGGKLLARYPLNDDMRVSFDISENPAGIYMVQCLSRKKWLSGKVVLMK